MMPLMDQLVVRRAAMFLLCPVALMATLAGCQETQEQTSQESPRNVRVLELEAGSLEEFFDITGPVAPVRGTDISAQESGPVTAILLAKGAPVQEGAPVLEQEREILRAEMESAEAALETQAFNLDKVQKLFDAGKVSRIELLDARTRFQNAKSAADIGRERFERARIRAPFDGILADRYVELGEMVLPGQKVVRVIDPYTLKLEGYLTADQIPYAREGVQAEVLLGDARQAVTGTVSWVGMEADVSTGKFKVEIRIPNEDLRLHSGVIGRARMPKHTSRDVVVIPREAVMKGRHGPEVFLVREDRARRAEVVLGPDQGAMVVVTSGLQAGDMLVVRGHRDLVDGSLVRITERATAADGTVPSDPEVISSRGTGAAR